MQPELGPVAAGSRARPTRSPRPVPPLVADTALAVATTVLSLLLGHEQPPAGWRELDPTGYALVVVLNLTTAARRWAPAPVLILCVTVWIGYISLGYWPVVQTFAVQLALYTVASRRGPRSTGVCAVLVCLGWLYAGFSNENSDMYVVTAQSVVVPAVLWWFGSAARRLVERNEQLAEVTEQLRREQEERARHAVADERTRIARELHDVVAHHMSVISVQAGLAHYVLDSDTATARAALSTVLEAGGEALEEMRRLLDVLRVDPREADTVADTYAPAPGLARLDELTNRIRAAGVPIALTVTGPVIALSPGADLCVYRIVQESLTNILKHAPGAAGTVELRYEKDVLTVRVANAPAPGGAPARSVGGRGLIGMRERATLYEGTLVVGPVAGGGFEVRLTLPTAAVHTRHA